MSLEPLITAPVPIQLHAYAALAALVLGGVQLLRPKGGTGHRITGYVWVALMLLIALSSLFIHEIRLFGPFSPLHILSLFILVNVSLAVFRARRGDLAERGRHRLRVRCARRSGAAPSGCYCHEYLHITLFTALCERSAHSVAD